MNLNIVKTFIQITNTHMQKYCAIIIGVLFIIIFFLVGIRSNTESRIDQLSEMHDNLRAETASNEQKLIEIECEAIAQRIIACTNDRYSDWCGEAQAAVFDFPEVHGTYYENECLWQKHEDVDYNPVYSSPELSYYSEV